MFGQARKLCVPCTTHERDVGLGIRRVRRDLKGGRSGNVAEAGGTEVDVPVKEGMGAGAG